ncbi:MAG: class I poly(R)-hydroxyalkanoic acid synthase [Anaerolineales bacterium]|nr:class I poly(R)-hydroxyalkanoic acid synthase [Anaerolineales bacterium]
MFPSFLDLFNQSLTTMTKAQKATFEAWTRSMEMTQNMAASFWGQTPPEDIDLGKDDGRFTDEAWRTNMVASFSRQSYLIMSKWMEDTANALDFLEPKTQTQVKFWTEQMADVLSPSNSPFTNPEVVRETVKTGGTNLVKGMQNFMHDAAAGRVTQVPDDAFVVGKDLACTPGKVVYRSPLMEIMQYTPTTEKVHAIPMLMVPPWINKYYVMDMAPENSLYKYLVDNGFTVFTISWKNPDESILDLEWDDYVQQGPLEALKVVQEITGAKKVNLVGYCLGGISSQVALAYLAAKGEDDIVNTATFFTTHQDYTCVGDITVFIDENWVKFLDWLMQASGGYLDGKNMGATFNMLRANDLLWRYVVSNYLLGQQPPAFALLYWNNDGTRVPGKVHSFLLREFFLHNKLQTGELEVLGTRIDLKKVKTPTYAVTASNDHIVPWQGAYKIRELMGGPVRFILTGGGHIAGVVNPPHPTKKRPHWVNDETTTTDPEEWRKGATEVSESWWTDWVPWLAKQSGRKINPPATGSEKYPPLMDAPGQYVLEK